MFLISSVNVYSGHINIYKITMKPVSNKLTRVISCYSAFKTNPFDKVLISLTKNSDRFKVETADKKCSAEIIEHLSKIYDQPIPKTEDTVLTFTGTFVNTIPNDFGNTGFFFKLTSPLGSFISYSEQLSGNINPGSQLQDFFDAADGAVYLVDGWLGSQLSDVPGWEKFHNFLVKEFKDDIKNFYLYFVNTQIGLNNNFQKEDIWWNNIHELTQLTFYLQKKGYLTTNHVRQLLQKISKTSLRRKYRKIIYSILENKLNKETNKAFVNKLVCLLEAESTNKTFETYLATTNAATSKIAEALLKCEKAGKSINKAEDLLELMCGIPFHDFELIPFDKDQVLISLKCPGKPISTNGKYDEKKQEITWTCKIRKFIYPSIAQAMWAEPNLTYQTNHFGKIIIEGKKLSEFVILYNLLTPEEKTEADSVLSDKISPEYIYNWNKEFDKKFKREKRIKDDTD